MGAVEVVGLGRAGRRDGCGVFLRYLPLPGLRGLPQFVVHDAEFGNLDDYPLLGRVEARDPLAGVGVLQEALAVPHQPADIELVVEQPRAAFRVAAQHGIGPELAGCAGDAVRVETPRDRARAGALRELAEDAPDDPGLGLVDLALAADALAGVIVQLHHVVAVADAAARLAGLDPAPQPPARLRREVLQEQRVHRALEADVKLVDLAFACREREDHHAGEAQMLVERRHVGLVAAHPVQRLGDDDLERAPPRVLKQRLDAGPEDHAVAGYGGVLVAADDLPALAFRTLAADPELVLDGSGPLLVGRIAGIERTAQGHGPGSPIGRAPPSPAAHCRWRLRTAGTARARSGVRAGGRAASRQRRSALPARPASRHCRSRQRGELSPLPGRFRLSASPPSSRIP